MWGEDSKGVLMLLMTNFEHNHFNINEMCFFIELNMLVIIYVSFMVDSNLTVM